MNRLNRTLLPVLAPALFSSCTIAVSNLTKPLPEIADGATKAEVHQQLGEPTTSQAFSPPAPLNKDPILRRRGMALTLRNDKRPAALRESFTLQGHYRKPDDPDGTGGLAQMSAKAFYLPEIFLGPFASLEYLARMNHRTRMVVWYSPQGRAIFHHEE